jgi:hypothetical protein
MSGNMQKLATQLANTKVTDVQRAAAVDAVGLSQVRDGAKPNPVTEREDQISAELSPGEKDKKVIERCMRTAELMRALFPNGLHLRSQQEFGTYRLFDGLVGSISQFAEAGMTHHGSLRAISLYATLLADLNSSTDNQ